MKVLLAFLVLLSLTAGAALRAAEPAQATIKYFVQVVRGTDDKTPPETGAKLIGAKLQKQLQPMFRWPHYWEVQQKPVTVQEGKTAKTDLKSGHVLEIDLREQGKGTVRLLRDGKVIRTEVCSRGQEFVIHGAERGDGKAWFVVVRTDSPSI